ncbi:sensor domain-containing protein [Streptomyces pimonensis]|uniref:sensor domain-containing protein n=1 Tax=Streptomyces pimonensis TaxID=2860288 RepID=UPI003527CF90
MSRPGCALSPWRSAGHLLTGAVTGAVVLVGIVVSVVAGGVLAPALVGFLLLLGTVLAGIPVARLERWWLADRDPVPDPRLPLVAPGLRAWLTARLRGRATWRKSGHALLFAVLLRPVDALAFTVVLLPRRP